MEAVGCRQHKDAPAADCEWCAKKAESAVWMAEASTPEFLEALVAALKGDNKSMSISAFARYCNTSPSNVAHFLNYGLGTKGGVVPKYMWRAAKELGLVKMQ